MRVYNQYELILMRPDKETAIYTVKLSKQKTHYCSRTKQPAQVLLLKPHMQAFDSPVVRVLEERKLSIVYFPNVLSSSKMNGYLWY